MNSFNIEDLKNLKINLKHDVAEGETVSNNVDYNIANPEEVSIHSSKGDRSLPLFSHADVKVNLYKEEEEDRLSSRKTEHARRCPSLQSIRAILQMSDEETDSNNRPDSYQRSIQIIRKLDEIVNKMKGFTENAKKKLKMKTYKKDCNKVFKKYLDESQDLFEELEKYHSKKRCRRESRSYRTRRRSFDRSRSSSTSADSERSPSPKRYRCDTSKTYGQSRHYDDGVHDKSSQSRRYPGSKNRAASVDSISSIDSSGSGEEIREETNRSRHDRSHEKHSRGSRHPRNAPKHSEWWYDRSYFGETSNAKEIERYYRYSYYAVMYAFPILMDMLRQDGLNNF